VSLGNALVVLVVLFMLFPPELAAINALERPALSFLVGVVRFIIPLVYLNNESDATIFLSC
jgi:hypothetical protein